MAKIDPQILAHLEWLGFVGPKGLVVSAPALVRAGALLEQRDIEGQRLLRTTVGLDPKDGPRFGDDATDLRIRDFRTFARDVLGWRFSPKGYAGTPEAPIPSELEVPIPDGGETLRPDYAVRELDPEAGGPIWQLLVSVIEGGADFDVETRGAGRLELSPHSRMERLLRNTGVAAGLLVNGRALRLISAPRGESAGWLDFRVADMVQAAGRPIVGAMRLLLCEQRLLALPRPQRLAALLADSRKFQNEVSEKLARQVLHALYELLRGFQAAHDASKGQLLRQVLAEHPEEVYRAMLTVILRMVFLLYAEERDMLPEDETFLGAYSISGLHERLREDAALYPDTMDQRFGAWAQLVALFRMIHDGAAAGGMHLPPRHGVLFQPDRFPFLEGRTAAGARQIHERIVPPIVPDGTIHRALEKLLVLDGERISYRALDVEQIGSVYETMMGFRLEIATGPSVAIRPQKARGAPTAIDLEALLAESRTKRAKWLQERTDRKPTDKVKKKVSEAANLDDLYAALHPVIDQAATPDVVPAGAMVLQPSEERRRSGSHYTPRELTEPIVRTTLEPLLARLRGPAGQAPRPDDILDLKVCDPAMGSGAFLVETCRQLGEALIESWHSHGERPAIPADEDEVVYARRLVARRCLYGVDRNPVAVDLAKMSLWLATLAKEHALTFVDHALRHGDALVGLSRSQIENFHWDTKAIWESRFSTRLHGHLERVRQLRSEIRNAGEDVPDETLRELWRECRFEVDHVRLIGDLVVSAYFEGDKKAARERRRSEYVRSVVQGAAERWRDDLEHRRHADPPFVPFHVEIEFPEVFDRENPGFDAFVGNPPFAGKNTIAEGNAESYPDWLKEIHAESHGNADLVAHFFRRAFDLLRTNGAMGLIATNTIAQGDTRASGLRWICKHHGEIYSVRKRVKWPGEAAVVVSVVHVLKGRFEGSKYLDGRVVETITAFLFHRGGHDDPERLVANASKSFVGTYVLGMAFTFDDTDKKGEATPIAEMERILGKKPSYREVIHPYIGGEEVNTSPTQAHHRYVINFGERSEDECRRLWPELMAIVEAKVKPERLAQDDRGAKEKWWQFIRTRPELHAAIAGQSQVLAVARVGQQAAIVSLPTGMVYSEQLIVFPFDTHAAFCALQARPHEVWARFFGSSMKDDLRYTPSDCFETFPFPDDWTTHPALEAAGRAYYEFRAALMVRNDEGLTATYNRFHDPNERDAEIVKLRELHEAMDRAVLDAYDWQNWKPSCDFLLDYEIDDEEWGNRKKPYRYRWSDEDQAELLMRLLDLNAERARAEARAGATAAGRRRGQRKSARRIRGSETGDLFQ